MYQINSLKIKTLTYCIKNKGKGRVNIDLSSHENRVDILVKDKGKGMNGDVKKEVACMFFGNYWARD